MLEELRAVIDDMRLQRVDESCFHKAVASWRSGTILFPGKDWTLTEKQRLTIGREDAERGIFLLQHNWAGAFSKAQDFEGGEFHLPYAETIFETRISGRRFCLCIAAAADEKDLCILLMESTVGWAIVGAYYILEHIWGPMDDRTDFAAPLMNLMREQTRAVCIALEAEVAVTQVVRAPYKLNQKRERAGKLPLYDFHIVELANRKRYLPVPPDGGMTEREHHGRRLHFVRGHWVHYVGHKSWRKWHLRGDPDLGFVDKEYRL